MPAGSEGCSRRRLPTACLPSKSAGCRLDCCRLLVRLVLSEGWRSKKTLARGVLPLQSVVAAFRSSYKAVPVTLQLEANSAAVGSLVCHVQLISAASIRAGMHEAIRRMRKMAAETRSSGASQEGNE